MVMMGERNQPKAGQVQRRFVIGHTMKLLWLRLLLCRCCLLVLHWCVQISESMLVFDLCLRIAHQSLLRRLTGRPTSLEGSVDRLGRACYDMVSVANEGSLGPQLRKKSD